MAVEQAKAGNIHFHEGNVTTAERHKAMGHKGCTVWMTGLSASGKSTIAVALEQVLIQRNIHSYRLDGDNIRFGLNKDAKLLMEKSGYAEAAAKRFGVGFSAEDRMENIRRIGEVSKLFADSGMVTITSFISPYRSDRDAVRKMHVEANIPFLEVHVDIPIEEAEKRDPKGLYKKARAGQIKGFTGIDDPYEAPLTPELKLESHKLSIAESVAKLIDMLDAAGVLKP